MAQLWNYQTGKPEEIPDNLAGERILDGTHAPLKGKLIEVMGPDGKFATISSENTLDYLKNGYDYVRPMITEEEKRKRQQYGDSPLTTIGLGALDSTTLGTSNHILTRTGLTTAEALREYKNRNPEANIVGQIVGILGLSLLTSGIGGAAAAGSTAARTAGGAAKLARFLPAMQVAKMGQTVNKTLQGTKALTTLAAKGVAGKAAAKAISMGAGSAVEGAFWGAKELVTENALGEADITAQKLATYMGTGALWGGTFGAGLAGGGELVKSGLVKTGNMAKRAGTLIKSKTDVLDWLNLEDMKKDANMRVILGNRAKPWRDIADKKLRQEADGFLDDFFKKHGYGKTTRKFAELIGQEREEIGAKIGKLVDDMDALQGSISRDNFVTGAKLANIVEGLRGTLGPKNAVSAPSHKFLDNVVRDWANRGDDIVSFRELRVVRQQLDNALTGEAVEGTTKQAKRLLRKLYNDTADEYSDKLIKAHGSKIGYSDMGAYRRLRRDYSAVSELDKTINQRAAAEAHSPILGMKDLLAAQLGSAISRGGAGVTGAGVGLAVGGIPGALVGAGAGLALNKAIKNYGDDVAAYLINRVSKLGMMEAAANTVTRKIDNTIVNTVRSITAEPGRMAKAAQSVAGAVGAKMPKPDIDTQKVIKDMGYGKRMPTTVEILGTYEERLDELAEFASNPEYLMEKLAEHTAEIGQYAENIAGEMAATAARAAQYLYENAPKPPIKPAASFATKWRPPLSEVYRFNRLDRVVNNPYHLTQALQTRTLTKDMVQAVQTVHPALYQEMVEKLMNGLVDVNKPIPRKYRKTLATFLGQPIDTANNPDIYRTMWGISSGGTEEEEAAQKPQGGIKSGGSSKVNLASGTQSEMNRLSSRRNT